MIEPILTSNNPYQLNKVAKQQILFEQLRDLTQFHYEHCLPYQRIIDKTGMSTHFDGIEKMPYLPVQLFKMLDMFSLPESEHFKTLKSSGTTGQQVSKIYIDRATSVLQTKALNVIVRNFLGKARLPMIVLDYNFLENRLQFSARIAATIGFSQFGHHHFYALNNELNIKETEFDAFLEQYTGQPLFLFGFTFIVWEQFIQYYRRKQKKLDLSESVLIHGGGWKKLQNQAVSDQMFKKTLQEQFNLTRVYNYYGMVEQVGSIYMQCEQGHLHTPDFADVLIRDPDTLDILPYGHKGLIQVLSILPRSYPGHSLLTEDVGMILGEDDCSCGRKGKYFMVEGRLPKAELRGCSDTLSV
ncbi:acyl-protein synthetase [Paenibacillus campi]|uniref:LuxE/PaaK family acyltransferase n=1 Tax=Paenibacillus campi TaxID=3106031 RepID=UPI002AFE1600|nr:acyl-protein synthetase [Paenibacillus sp. SGZ-1014]